MKRETLLLNIVLGVGMIALALWIVARGGAVGVQYVEPVERIAVYAPDQAVWERGTDGVRGRWVDPATGDLVTPDTLEPARTWTVWRNAPRSLAGAEGVRVSLSRSIGLWLAALLTLCVFSFLYRDNPFYKAAEALVVGVSAAYFMVVSFWTMIVPNLLGKLIPAQVQNQFSPDLDAERNLWFLVVLVLSLMLLWRLSPVGGWIARWPLAFIIGITAGLRLIGFLQADFVAQIQASIMPLVVHGDAGFSFWYSVRNVAILLGVMACLTYFFFSIEHKGFVGKTARTGIWVLMITFGAGFAYTVMGRFTLLTRRVEFLFDDWLRILGG